MVTSVVNRYYDPQTDQFLSIDPMVATTGQPYVFTNDNPLNAEDPLGLRLLRSQDYKGVLSKTEVDAIAKAIVQKLKNKNIPIVGNAADLISRSLRKYTSKSGELITFRETSRIVSEVAGGMDSVARVTGIIGAFVTSINDANAGHGAVYAVADGGFSLAGGMVAGEQGAAACIEFGWIAVACGFGAGIAGSGITHAVFGNLFG